MEFFGNQYRCHWKTGNHCSKQKFHAKQVGVSKYEIILNPLNGCTYTFLIWLSPTRFPRALLSAAVLSSNNGGRSIPSHHSQSIRGLITSANVTADEELHILDYFKDDGYSGEGEWLRPKWINCSRLSLLADSWRVHDLYFWIDSMCIALQCNLIDAGVP